MASHCQPDTVPPHLWSISYAQLLQLDETASADFGIHYLSKTMRDIVNAYVVPSCKNHGKSYALTLNPEGLAVDAFISHSWDEPFKAFVDSIRKVFQTAVKKPNLWICAFALVQGNEALLEKQVGSKDSPLTESPFVKALQAASTFVVVRNSVTDLYSRIWCVCELIFAQNLGLVPHKTHVTGPDCFSDLRTTCLDAKSTKAEDKARILRVLLSEHDYEAIDSNVQAFRMQETPDAWDDNALLAHTQSSPTGILQIENLPLSVQEMIRQAGNEMDHRILTNMYNDQIGPLLAKAAHSIGNFDDNVSITAIEIDLTGFFAVSNFFISRWLQGTGEPHGEAYYNLACMQSLLVELQLCACRVIFHLPSLDSMETVARKTMNEPLLSHVAVGRMVPPESDLFPTIGQFLQARLQAAQKCIGVAMASGYYDPEHFKTDRDLMAFRELSSK